MFTLRLSNLFPNVFQYCTFLSSVFKDLFSVISSITLKNYSLSIACRTVEVQCPARITFTLGPSKRFWVHRVLLLQSEYKGFYFSPVYTILHSTDFQLWSEFKRFLFHRHTRFSKVLFCQGFLVTLRTLIWAFAFVLLPWRMAVDRGVTVQTPNFHSWSERKSWFYRILFISHFSQTCMVLHNPESLLWSECIFHTGIQRLECLTFLLRKWV